jgi:hypothetical protein
VTEREWDLHTWEGRIEYLAFRGFDAAEIADELRVMSDPPRLGFAFTRTGERLFWRTLHDRRRILALIETLTGSAVPTAAEVRAKLDELKSEGQPHGVGSIARALNASEATVRRRLGRIK